jgi:hypothetical protein
MVSVFTCLFPNLVLTLPTPPVLKVNTGVTSR